MATEQLEAECKFRVAEPEKTESELVRLGGEFLFQQNQCDTYLRHPSRDFRSTDEALRIREVDGEPFITYKGPRLEGPIKVRPEIELPLVPDTVSDWLRIWKSLGFEIVAQVKKQRRGFSISWQNRPLTVTMDYVEGVGNFAEIERIIEDRSQLEQAENDIMQFAGQLGLAQVEKRSYLGLLLLSR